MNFPYFADSDVESDSLNLSTTKEPESPPTMEREDAEIFEFEKEEEKPVDKLEEIKQKLVEACCSKTQSMFSVIYLLHEHYTYCNDITPKKKTEIKNELLERIQLNGIQKSRLKLVETVLGNFFQ
jgi:hypothetical protein